MANNADFVSTGKPKIGGAVFNAPTGTTLPTSATAVLNEAFVSMGYCSDDGLRNNTGITSSNIKAWGGDTVLAVQEGRDDIYTVTLIESVNINVLKAVFGAENVSGTLEEGISVRKNSAELDVSSWVFDMILKNGIAKRIVIPSGQVTNVGEITYADADVIGYQVTITATPGTDGDTSKEYIYKPAVVPETDPET